MYRRAIVALFLLAVCVPGLARAEAFAPKVMIITMFGEEAKPWIASLELPRKIKVPGLAAGVDEVLCNDHLCMMTTQMGFANAAASTMALSLSDKFDLRKSYFIIAGIAGVNPAMGTLGTAAWADYVVDSGLIHEIDNRDIPADWASGILELGAKHPGEKPQWSAGTEVYALNPALVRDAFESTRQVPLADGKEAEAYRSAYTQPAARAKPSVIICASISSDTYWHGARMAEAMAGHVALLTDGKAKPCMSQMEDNATLTALTRAAEAGRVDISRVALVRTGANFERAHAGQNDTESLVALTGGFQLATENAYRIANAYADRIIGEWQRYEAGVPQP